MNVVIIETHEKDGVEWGISLTDHNPTPENYIGCKDYESAKKLKELLKNPKDKEFTTELSILLDKIGAKKQYPEGMYIFDGRYINVSKIKNMEDLAMFFYKEGQNRKIQEVKHVLNIIDPRI
jgi:hypothetical protein